MRTVNAVAAPSATEPLVRTTIERRDVGPKDVFIEIAYAVGGKTGRAPARRVDAVDTTAAGDTFVGYLAATAGASFAARLRTALGAGSLTVTKLGSAGSIPQRAEVEAWLADA